MPPQKRKYMDSARNGNPVYKRSKPTAKDRRDRARDRVTTVIRGPGPIPPRAIVKMKYSDVYNSNGVNIDHVWNLNSTFDPDRTGTGHQPYGRDTYAALYNRYRVFAVSYVITFVTTNVPGYAYLVWDNEPGPFSTPSLVNETPKALAKPFTLSNPAIFKGHLTLANIVGQTAAQYKADDRFQAINSADPTETIVLHTVMSGFDNSVLGADAATCRVQLTYHVEWFDQNKLSQS